LDEGVIKEISIYCKKQIGVVPDITNEDIGSFDTNIIRRIIENASNRPIVSLLGHLTHRKGVSELCKIAQLPEAEDMFFVFAGKLESLQLDPKIRLYLAEVEKGAHKNAFGYFQRIRDEAEFNSLVSISDIIYARYIDFYASSNILTKAARFKKPVFVSAQGCMADRVIRYGTGLIFGGRTEQQALAELQRLIELKKRIPLSSYLSYSNDHSFKKLVETLCILENNKNYLQQSKKN
jgi:hypothetical protein